MPKYMIENLTDEGQWRQFTYDSFPTPDKAETHRQRIIQEAFCDPNRLRVSPAPQPPMMYVLAPCKILPLYARLHVMCLELELTDEPSVFTDFLKLCQTLREDGIDNILVVGSEDEEWSELVERTLHDLNFNMCVPENFPE